MKLTKKQLEVSDFIENFIAKNDRKPTFKEIMKKLKLKSLSSVWNRIDRYKKNIKNCPFCDKAF